MQLWYARQAEQRPSFRVSAGRCKLFKAILSSAEDILGLLGIIFFFSGRC